MNKNNKGTARNTLYYVLIILAMVMVVYFFLGDGRDETPEIQYSTFTEQLEAGDIESFNVQPTNSVYQITGEYEEEKTVNNNNGLAILGSTESTTKQFSTVALPNDSTFSEISELADENSVQTSIEEESSSGIWVSLLISFLPLLGLLVLFY
ncbi:ATP-dependent metallopeptidase FtsH/Yme1/Tma family protein, partial [Vagococcus lutrae]|uniref:ATP-dependent metallopeptidase FtsH/Yme1/Tma family protein n=1 Tax=Vagococcus lutrae TaxID=81947 RepID=UPI001929D5F7